MVPPKGEPFARAGSTWIHWKSSVALAKRSIRSWEISTQGEMPTSSPILDSSSRSLIAVLAMRLPYVFFYFTTYQIGFLMHDPVRGVRHPHELEIGHALRQSLEAAREQRRVALAPEHQRRYPHHEILRLELQLPRARIVGGGRIERRGTIVIQAARERARLRP